MMIKQREVTCYFCTVCVIQVRSWAVCDPGKILGRGGEGQIGMFNEGEHWGWDRG